MRKGSLRDKSREIKVEQKGKSKEESKRERMLFSKAARIKAHEEGRG